MNMPFGKYKGKPLCKLPEDYLLWLDSIDLEPGLRRAVDMETRRRFMPAVAKLRAPERLRSTVAAIVTSGFRGEAFRRHPDHGGTDAAMRELIEAKDWLMKVLQ